MRTFLLTVRPGPTLVLAAPDGDLPVAGTSPEVGALLASIPVGTEIECAGAGADVRHLIVDRIVGASSALDPLLPARRKTRVRTVADPVPVPDTADVTFAQIHAPVNRARVIGGTPERIEVGGAEKNESFMRRRGQLVRGEPIPVRLTYDLTGRRVARKVTDSRVLLDRASKLDWDAQSASVVGASGVAECIAPPPWHFGDWEGIHVEGYRLCWQGEQMLLAAPDGPYLAFTLAFAPRSVGIALPWCALERTEGHFLVVLLDDLLRIPELYVGGERVLARAAVVARPTATPAQIALFDALVEHGLLAPMELVARDLLLLRTFGADRKLGIAAMSELLVAAESPRAVWHDTHWFEESDGIIARIDAALAGEPVRFVPHGVADGVVRFEVVAGEHREPDSTGALLWETASALDGHLAKHHAARRVYALETKYEELFVFVVLSAAERTSLIERGVRGIRKDVAPRIE